MRRRLSAPAQLSTMSEMPNLYVVFYNDALSGVVSDLAAF